MATGFGHKTFVGWGAESTYGTAVSRTKWYELAGDDSLALKQTTIAQPTIRQISTLNTVPSKKSVEGGFRVQFGFEGLELLLKHALGSVSTTENQAGTRYTHVFTGADSLPTGLTVEMNRDAAALGGDYSQIYEGCQISKLTFGQEVENVMSMGVELVGEDMALGAVSSPTYPTFRPVTWDLATTHTLNSNVVYIESFEISIENQLATDRYRLGSRVRKGLGRAGARKITGKITAEWEYISHYQLFTAETDTPISLVFTGATLGSANYALTFTIPRAKIQAAEPQVSDAGPIKQTFEFEAFRSSTAGDELSITLVNGTASV